MSHPCGVLASALLAAGFLLAQNKPPANLTVQDMLKLPQPPADHRIPYGTDPLQFGDLRLPKTKGPHPVVIFIHGGCWQARFDLAHTAGVCAALTAAGVATWSLEYRRVGNPGGGWPGTFEDVARGADHLRSIARQHRLDLRRVVAAGHSAGGHLALWLAARQRLPKTSPLYAAKPLKLRGVVSLAGVGDLRAFDQRTPRVCGDAISQLLGGSPSEAPQNYRHGSPFELLPLGVPQRLINGGRDQIVPLEVGRHYEEAARRKRDKVTLTVLDDAGHFEFVAAQSAAYPVIEKAVLDLLNGEKR